MSDLKEQAEELGIKVDGRWSEEKIQEAIDEKLNEDEPDKEGDQPSSIKNVSGRRHKVYSAVLKPGETYTPTDEDKEDVRTTKRVSNAVAMGHLEWV